MDIDELLQHYASPYYDPVKAHEYYMRTRELKGRRSTTKLNDCLLYTSPSPRDCS